MSDQTTDPTPVANATDTPKTKRTPSEGKTPTTLDGIARAMLRARGVRSDERLSEQKKVLRGQLRGKYWASLTKSAPKSYGPRGSIKREPADGNRWGAIPADVARAIIKDAKR